TVYDKLTGKTAQEKDFIIKSISDLTGAHSSYITYLTQDKIAEAQSDAIANGDNYTAKNLQDDLELNLFMNVGKYGVADEYFESLGDNLKAAAEGNANFEKEFLQDRTIDEVVMSLKEKYNKFNNAVSINRKSIGSPYKDGTREANAWDTAIQIATDLEQRHESSMKRIRGLQQDVQKKYPVKEVFLSALLDPMNTLTEISKLEDVNRQQKERLGFDLSEQERATTQKEIKENEQIIQVLQKVKEKYFDKNNELKDRNSFKSEEVVAEILRGAYGENQDKAPKELRTLLEDINKLTLDAEEYLNLYNLLSNPEYFSKFGEAYVAQYMSKVNRINNRINNPKVEAQESAVTQEQKLTQEQFDEALEEIPGEQKGEIISYNSKIQDITDNKEVEITSDGKYKYNSKEFANINDLFNEIKKENKFDQNELNRGNAEKLLKQRLNDLLGDLKEEAQVVQEANEEVKEATKPLENRHPSVNPNKEAKPKTKADSENDSFFFVQNTSGQTMLHYFDLVLANIWDKAKNLLSKLDSAGKTAVLKSIQEARDKVGTESTISNIFLADMVQIEEFLGDNIKNFNDKQTDIQVVHDGIRLYIITAGNAVQAQATIEAVLGVTIPTTSKIVSLVNSEGGHIVSGFRAALGLNGNNDRAVHAARKGDNVNLRVMDSEFNRNLLAEDLTDNEKIDQITIGVYNAEEELVGILRAGDFLFELRPEEVSAYRQKIVGEIVQGGQIQLGALVGTTTVTQVSTARNYNIVNGKKIYTAVGEYSPKGFTKEYFYVKED
ncbi:MAG: hypothetical protein WD512_15870, partial [Candidatus Paceibacterota bacterium]